MSEKLPAKKEESVRVNISSPVLCWLLCAITFSLTWTLAKLFNSHEHPSPMWPHVSVSECSVVVWAAASCTLAATCHSVPRLSCSWACNEVYQNCCECSVNESWLSFGSVVKEHNVDLKNSALYYTVIESKSLFCKLCIATPVSLCAAPQVAASFWVFEAGVSSLILWMDESYLPHSIKQFCKVSTRVSDCCSIIAAKWITLAFGANIQASSKFSSYFCGLYL